MGEGYKGREKWNDKVVYGERKEEKEQKRRDEHEVQKWKKIENANGEKKVKMIHNG